MPLTTQIRTSKAGVQRRPWSVGRRRLRPACLVVLTCAASAWTAAPAVAANGASPRHVKPSQAVAQLLFTHRVYKSASTRSPLGRSLPPRTPLTGEQTTLPIVGYATGVRRRWLRVMLPGRPNSSTGWIEQGGTHETTTGWRIIVSTPRRQVWVYFDGHLLESYPAVVGKPSTPTPTGNFFVEETETMPSTAAGGPYVLALSARSNVLQDFDGGPGQIGIHGRDNLGGTLGQAESHGCMRLATDDITWLAARIGPGVPVTILG
jgi:lipoprotein-anchoring transpeptidase ErfK/SrfK